MSAMKTPGVYVVERNAFPTAVVEVPTAIPAFIGYTEKAMNGNKSLRNKPCKITSMAEYTSFFGGAPEELFDVSYDAEKGIEEPGKHIQYNSKYTLYYHMLFFFANGGGACYIVSVGDYTNVEGLTADLLKAGIDTLLKEQEPTMLVIPEAVNLSAEECGNLQEAMLRHCGAEMRNRVAILDVYEGYKGPQEKVNDKDKSIITHFRDSIGSNFLNYGMAYYSWVNTAILQESDITLVNIPGTEGGSPREKLHDLLSALVDKMFLSSTGDDPKKKEYEAIVAKIKTVEKKEDVIELDKTLKAVFSFYKEMMTIGLQKVNRLPVSAAMAGIYTTVDNTRGVWKAPANISLAGVVGPTVNLTNAEQEDLNMPLNGKAINAIRYFKGEGIKVWGARTLDGNSGDWRFVNVRRTVIMLEESIKNAARAYVFDPNVGNTWVSLKSTINNFLHGIWKQGGLAGATPDEAYSVHVGLGDTMTSEDILNGVMKITVLIALTRPAEFIQITFQQQMQKS